MIKLTRLDGSEFVVNANLIEVVEANPDTVVSLITSKKFLVKETPEQITEQVIKHYKKTGGPRLIVYTDHSHQSEEHPAPTPFAANFK
ncbi:MAG: flagellar FlbD family protein [Actinomycetota bacterium]|nr:flagellar FlbD family protein [Actinomycetota bacterium]